MPDNQFATGGEQATVPKPWREVSTDYYACRADTVAEALAKVAEYGHEQLVSLVINSHLNRWVSDHADDRGEGQGLEVLLTHNESGKNVPYIGWVWRSVEFVGGRIPVADCGDFIGFCENNKWGYDQRDLTDDEQADVVALVWKAKRASEDRGGNSDEIAAAVAAVLDELWEYMQALRIPVAPWNR